MAEGGPATSPPRTACFGGRSNTPTCTLTPTPHRCSCATPRPGYAAETKVRLSGLPDQVRCFNHAEAALALDGDDDNFVKLATLPSGRHGRRNSPRSHPVPDGWSRRHTVVGPPGDDWTYPRIVVEHRDSDEQSQAGGDTERYPAYTNRTVSRGPGGGVWTHSLGDEQIGPVAMGAPIRRSTPRPRSSITPASTTRGGPRGHRRLSLG